ncbi:MAG: hemolytic enterotoxin [Xenococcaceae cyanobacterium MO_188.B32]|nr:hemolytic enterotoxin [Xenococcaceae cyanobacterium MO_188.B32]
MSLSIESDLKEILTKIDNRLDRIDQRFENLENKFEQKFENLENKFDNRFEKLETKLNEVQVSVARLEEKTEGLSKRIESQEFVSRGVLIGLIVAILGGAAKLFGFVGNP